MAKKKEELKEEIKEEAVKDTADTEEETSHKMQILLAQKEKEVEEMKDKLSETEDRLLRTLAEYDNFKKRTVREKEEIYFLSKSDLIKKLLPVFDNFDRAQMFTDAKDYKEGVDMIISQFFQILEGMEVRQIAEVGDEFDPDFHEAILREEKEGVEENKITEVLQKGYAVGDKVIRHAMVKVSG